MDNEDFVIPKRRPRKEKKKLKKLLKQFKEICKKYNINQTKQNG